MFNSATFSLLITCQQGLLVPFHLWFSWCLVYFSHSFSSWCSFFNVPFLCDVCISALGLSSLFFFHLCFTLRGWDKSIDFFLTFFFFFGPLKKKTKNTSLNFLQCCFCFLFILVWFGLLVKRHVSSWHLSSLTSDRTHTPCFGRWSLNLWTTREDPKALILVSECFDDCTSNIL